MLNEKKIEKIKHDLTCAAFTAWQMKETKKTFHEYLISLGIAEKTEKIPEKVKKQLIEKNIALAEKIRKVSKSQRGIKNEKAV